MGTTTGRTWLIIGAAALLGAAAGCASGGHTPDAAPVDDIDAAVAGPIDAADNGPPDAAENPPDAAIPDATPLPDRDPFAPDAMPLPDAPPPCPTEPCDLVDQCGCAAPQVCDLDQTMLATGATICRDVTQEGTETSECELVTECAGGFLCIRETLRSSCKAYCRDDTDCVAPGGRCILNLMSGSTPIPGVTVCTDNCSPIDSSGCPPSWGCNLFFLDPDDSLPTVTGDEEALTDCNVGGLGGQGATCTGTASCMAGLACITVDMMGNKQCLRHCTYPVGGECAPTETCFELSPAAVIGTTEYGVCFDPTP